ncbi:MAG: caspase family protein [Cyclobacteriaceae bacterium]
MKFILPVLIFISFSLSAQVPNLSGNWSGTTKTPLGVYQVHETYAQTGLTFSGSGKMINLKRTDSASYELQGFVDGNDVELRLIRFNYKTGTQCLSKVKMKYSASEDQQTLIGRWGKNLVKGGCLPGFSGEVKMMKVNTPDGTKEDRGFKQVSKDRVLDVRIDEADHMGQALMNRLNTSKYYALIIGIENYQADGIARLDNPIGDAEKLKNVLEAKYRFGNDNVTFLKNPGRSEVIEQFDKLTKKVTEQDQLLIFYAGHGIWDKDLEQGYWLPVDASLESKANWLSNSTIRDYLRGIKSKHTLLITDACFSGGILKERSIFQNSRAMLELYKMPSRKAITSGTLTTVPDNSVFIKYLISNLESNESPLISSGELFSKFKIAVINNSPNGQVPQYGVISQAGDEGGEFVFLKKND